MTPLFTTDIIVDGEVKLYDVFFSDDAYQFEPDDASAKPFSVRREEDVWKVSGLHAPIAQQQATAALDRYLLSQH